MSAPAPRTKILTATDRTLIINALHHYMGLCAADVAGLQDAPEYARITASLKETGEQCTRLADEIEGTDEVLIETINTALLTALREIVEKETNTYASDEGKLCNRLTAYMAQIANLAIAHAEAQS